MYGPNKFDAETFYLETYEMKHPQSGFTLIELVIVIVILGILAATALPRFTDLSSDARVAAVNGLAGALRSAAMISRATQIAKGYPSASTVSLEGQDINMSSGYPVASNISVALADTTLSGFVQAAPSVSHVTFTASGRNAGTCTVEYIQSTGTGFTASVTTGGC